MAPSQMPAGKGSGNHQDVSAGTKGPATARSLLRGYPYHDGNRIPGPVFRVRLIREHGISGAGTNAFPRRSTVLAPNTQSGHTLTASRGLLSALRVYPRRINGKRLPLRSELPKVPFTQSGCGLCKSFQNSNEQDRESHAFQIHRHNRIQHLWPYL